MAARYDFRYRSGNPYVYSPLDESRRTIRLIKILPSLTKGYLSLAIKHVSLAQAGQYHTISYTWGNDDPSYPVYLGREYLLLRKSIWSFLRHCQRIRSCFANWLWIDSICINQSDVSEKNQQVSIMGQIFRESSGTLVWLEGMSIKGSFARSYQAYWSSIPRNVDEDEKDRLLDIFLYGSTELKINEKRRTIRQDALEMFKHPYWCRLWIVQEVILSNFISIIFGRTTLSLDSMLRSLYDSTPYDHEQSFISGLFRDRYLDYSLQRLHTNRLSGSGREQSLVLLSLLSEYSNHGCKDIRDRVYGLLSLTDESDRIAVDYNCHIIELFDEVLSSHVTRIEDFGSKRENMHMHDVYGLMQALCVCPKILLEYQNHGIVREFTDHYKIEMFPTVVYSIASRQSDSTFTRVIERRDEYNKSTLSMREDTYQDSFHRDILAELHRTNPLDTNARYLLCRLSLSRFHTIIRIARDGDIALVGTIKYTGRENEEGNLMTPISMPSYVLQNINNDLNRSGNDFRRAAYKGKVEWPGYIVRCSTKELIFLQGSHDRLTPEEVLETR